MRIDKLQLKAEAGGRLAAGKGRLSGKRVN